MAKGVGLVLPFQRDGRGDFAHAYDEKLYASEMEMILTTQGDSPASIGELPWRTSFGAGLHRLRFMPNSVATRELARTMIQKSLKRWMPEVIVRNVGAQRSGNTLELFIHWGFRTGIDAGSPVRIKL